MRLKELQKQFADQIYNSNNNKIFSEINSDKVSVFDRIQIYRNNVFGSFDSVLELTYPATKQLVGADYFQNLCSKYHQKYKSTSGNLDEYGKYFSKLIGNLKNQHKLAYLKDLAALEWRYHLAYFALDVAAFDLEKFQKLKQKDLFKVKFKLHPSCHLISSNQAIYSVWEFTQKKNNKKLDLKNLDQELILIERASGKVNIHKVLEAEFLFLKQIKKQKNIYQIYQDLSKKYPDIDIGSLINKYISNGVLSRFFIGF